MRCRPGAIQPVISGVSTNGRSSGSRSMRSIGMDDLARHEGDRGPALDRGVRLRLADGGAEADVDAGGGAGEAEEEGVVVGAVDVAVGRAVLGDHVASPAAVPDALACVVAAEDDRLRLHADGGERGTEAPADKEPRLVRRDLDAGADVAEGGGGLEEEYAVAGLGEGVGGGKTAEACADDDDVEAECGTPTVIEWGDLLDGDLCSDLG